MPKGALAAYHTATWDWLGFPYILEEGDKYFDVDFELTGLTVKPFQPEIAISGRSVSFILVPDSGSFCRTRSRYGILQVWSLASMTQNRQGHYRYGKRELDYQSQSDRSLIAR